MLKRLFVVAALAALAVPSSATAATAMATVTAKIVKPLSLTGGGTLALGTIVTPQTGTYSGVFTVQPALTQTGTFCPANFTCSGRPAAASFNIQGQNNTPLNVTIPRTITLTQTDYGGTGAPPTIVMTTSNSLFANNGSGVYVMSLPNSGAPGVDFYIGGSITVNQSSPGGNFAGTIDIVADYQ